MFRIIMFVVIVSLVSCVTIPLESDPALANMIAALKQAPDNAELHNKLLKAYYEKYKQGNISRYLDKAIRQAEILSLRNSLNLGEKIRLYSLLSEKSSTFNEDADFKKLADLYQQNPQLKMTNVPPPSYVKSITALSRDRVTITATQLISYLKQAIKENPSHAPSSIMLGKVYEDEGKLNLTVALFETAITIAPNNAKVRINLAEVYDDLALRQYCSGKSKKLFMKAVTNYKKAISLGSEDANSHSALSRIYGRIGRNNLSIFEAKKYSELEKGDKGRDRLADTLYDVGKASDALAVYREILKNSPTSPAALQMVARSMFVLGRWDEAIDAWGDFRGQRDKRYFYGYLTEILAVQKVSGINSGREKLSNYIKGMQLNSWEQNLTNYHLGKLTGKQLVELSSSACQRTEAFYYVGFQNMLKGDYKNAKLLFEKALGEKIYGFNEYTAAKYHLLLL